MGRANSGDGIMAKKQNKTGIIGGKKPRSSGELYADIENREYKAWKKNKQRYQDRGKAGEDMIKAEARRSEKAEKRDKPLIVEYGKDAPKARTFGTKYPAPKKRPQLKAASTRAGHSSTKTTKAYATSAGASSTAASSTGASSAGASSRAKAVSTRAGHSPAKPTDKYYAIGGRGATGEKKTRKGIEKPLKP